MIAADIVWIAYLPKVVVINKVPNMNSYIRSRSAIDGYAHTIKTFNYFEKLLFLQTCMVGFGSILDAEKPILEFVKVILQELSAIGISPLKFFLPQLPLPFPNK